MQRRQFLVSLAAAAAAVLPYRRAEAGLLLEPPGSAVEDLGLGVDGIAPAAASVPLPPPPKSALPKPEPKSGEHFRHLTFHHAHTGERLTVDWVKGKAPAQAQALDWFMRDWRESKPHAVDHGLLDIAWDMTQSLHYDGVLQVLCGYRTPKTNTMLIRTGHGAVDHSTHLEGKALDFTLPGRDLASSYSAACALGRGGVGGYGGGGWFLHIDTGRVRHWMNTPHGLYSVPRNPFGLFPRSPYGLRPLSAQFNRRSGLRPSAEALKARVRLIKELEKRLKDFR